MGSTKQNIILGIIVVLAAWNIFTTNSIKTDVEGYEKKIDSVQTQIDSAQVVNKHIDLKVTKADSAIVGITKEIHHIDTNIITIKKQTDEKVTLVDHYGNAELEQLFAKRYN